MLTELVEFGHKLDEKMKAMLGEIKEKMYREPIVMEGNWNSNQQCGPEGRKKHPSRKE